VAFAGGRFAARLLRGLALVADWAFLAAVGVRVLVAAALRATARGERSRLHRLALLVDGWRAALATGLAGRASEGAQRGHQERRARSARASSSAGGTPCALSNLGVDDLLQRARTFPAYSRSLLVGVESHPGHPRNQIKSELGPFRQLLGRGR